MLRHTRRLTLSDRAQARIRGLLAQGGHTGRPVRIFAERADDGAIELGLSLDDRREDDLEVPADGLTVVADARTVEIARDRVIDYETRGFTLAVDPLANPGYLPNSYR